MTKPMGIWTSLDSQQTENTAQNVTVYKHNHAPYSSSMFFSFIEIFDKKKLYYPAYSVDSSWQMDTTVQNNKNPVWSKLKAP